MITYFFFLQDVTTEEEEAEERQSSVDFLKGLGVQNPCVKYTSGMYTPGNANTNAWLYDLDVLKATIVEAVPEEQRMLLSRNFRGFSEQLIDAKFKVLQVCSYGSI